MKQYMTAGAALLMTTTIASAGGLDRSGQGIGAIFEDGDYAELSYGSVTPSVSGNVAGVFQSGNIAPNYTQIGMALKMQINDQVSLALIYDQPFGANVDYADPAYPAGGSFAEVESDGVTFMGRYEINPTFSVHGGVRYVQANGVYNPAQFGATLYNSVYDTGSGTGFVVGGAYERDDIAMRIALTYSSEIDLELDGTVGDLSTTLPESINLDFQTGIAADTLLFGSVRYVAWDGFALNDSAVGDILEYDADVYTYSIGVGRRITDQLAASFAVGYEKSSGELTGQLGPTDGYISYQLGASYAMDSGVEVSGGVRYVDVGDAVTGPPVNGVFDDNSAVALGLKIGFTF